MRATTAGAIAPKPARLRVTLHTVPAWIKSRWVTSSRKLPWCSTRSRVLWVLLNKAVKFSQVICPVTTEVFDGHFAHDPVREVEFKRTNRTIGIMSTQQGV